MALTECKECGGKVSTSADFCPHCGYKEEEQPKKQAEYQGSTCSKCGHPMPWSANKCEHCGHQPSGWLWVTLGVIVVFIFMFMSWLPD